MRNLRLEELEKSQRKRLNDSKTRIQSDSASTVDLSGLLNSLDIQPKKSRSSSPPPTSKPHHDLKQIPATQVEDQPPLVKDEHFADLEFPQFEIAADETVRTEYEQPSDFFKEAKIKLLNFATSAYASVLDFRDINIRPRMDASDLCEAVAQEDPEFILKTALYTRNVLNTRTLSNLMLAFAAHNLSCRKYLDKYFCSIINLPTDWLETLELYGQISGRTTIPRTLAKVMREKFAQFSDFHLRKYNSIVKIRSYGWKKKKLTLKIAIKLLHIKYPRDKVMKAINARYPSDLDLFIQSELPGSFDQSMAGKKMKFDPIITWERELSLNGNSKEAWERLIDQKALGYMALIRNLRNIVSKNVSEKHIRAICDMIQDEEQVRKSRQFPQQLYRAYFSIDSSLQIDEDKPVSDEQRNNEKLLIEALSKAFRISAKHELPPIPGHNAIIIDVEQIVQNANDDVTVTSKNVEELLFGLMMCSRCESYSLVFHHRGAFQQKVGVEAIDMLKFGAVETLRRTAIEMFPIDSDGKVKSNPTDLTETIYDFNFLINEVCSCEAKQIDNIITVSNCLQLYEFVKSSIHYYRHHRNPRLFSLNLFLQRPRAPCPASTANDIFFVGISEKVLRYITERDPEGQLRRVEQIDQEFGLLKSFDVRVGETKVKDARHFPNIPRWRNVRVFISSTFKDMQNERDFLAKYVFPELRNRARGLSINLYDIDLRWGVVEESGDGCVRVCLNEAGRNDIFIGILGDRYGFRGFGYDSIDVSRHPWINQYRPGASITELEMIEGAFEKFADAKDKAFFYLRNNSFIKNVPAEHRRHLEESDEDGVERLNDLKSRIISSGFEVFKDYPCNFAGISTTGMVVLRDLEEFGKRVFDNVWNCLLKLRLPKNDFGHLNSELNYMNAKFEEFAARPIVRKQLFDSILADLKQKRQLIAINGSSGSGKSTMFCQVLKALKQSKSYSHVFHYLPDGAHCSLELMLRVIVHQLMDQSQQSKTEQIENADLADELIGRLRKMTKVLIAIDGPEWFLDTGETVKFIEKCLSTKINLILCSSNEFGQFAGPNIEIARYTLKELDYAEKKVIAVDILSKFAKVLGETSWKNQLRLLLTKNDSKTPIYLYLACEEILRMTTSHEHVTFNVSKLPGRFDQLISSSVQRTSKMFGRLSVNRLLSILLCVDNGINEDDLLNVLYIDSLVNCERFDEILESLGESLMVSSSAKSEFFIIRDFLSGLLSPGYEHDNGIVAYVHREVQQCVLAYLRRLKNFELFTKQSHRLISVYFTLKCDPKRNGRWDSGGMADEMVKLVSHLMRADEYETAERFLSDQRFLRARCLCGNISELLKDFNEIFESSAIEISKHPLFEVFNFIRANAHVLKKHPGSLIDLMRQSQIEISGNIEDETKNGLRPLFQTMDRVIIYDSADNYPTCVHFNTRSIAFGTQNGGVFVVNALTTEFSHSFYGHNSPLLAVRFVDDNLLVSASENAAISAWDLTKKIRLIEFRDEHSAKLSGLDCGHGLLATSGLDGRLSIRNSTSLARVVVIEAGDIPISCIRFHPVDLLLFSAPWKVMREGIKCWNPYSGDLLFEIDAYVNLTSLTVGFPYNFLIGSSFEFASDSAYDIYSRKTVGEVVEHERVTHRRGFSSPLQSLEPDLFVSSCCRRLAYSNLNQAQLKWKVECGVKRAGEALCLAASRHRFVVVVGYTNSMIGIYNFTDGKFLISFQFEENCSITKLAIGGHETTFVFAFTDSNKCFVLEKEDKSAKVVCAHELDAAPLEKSFFSSSQYDLVACLADGNVVAFQNGGEIRRINVVPETASCCCWDRRNNIWVGCESGLVYVVGETDSNEFCVFSKHQIDTKAIVRMYVWDQFLLIDLGFGHLKMYEIDDFLTNRFSACLTECKPNFHDLLPNAVSGLIGHNQLFAVLSSAQSNHFYMFNLQNQTFSKCIDYSRFPPNRSPIAFFNDGFSTGTQTMVFLTQDEQIVCYVQNSPANCKFARIHNGQCTDLAFLAAEQIVSCSRDDGKVCLSQFPPHNNHQMVCMDICDCQENLLLVGIDGIVTWLKIGDNEFEQISKWSRPGCLSAEFDRYESVCHEWVEIREHDLAEIICRSNLIDRYNLVLPIDQGLHCLFKIRNGNEVNLCFRERLLKTNFKILPLWLKFYKLKDGKLSVVVVLTNFEMFCCETSLVDMRKDGDDDGEVVEFQYLTNLTCLATIDFERLPELFGYLNEEKIPCLVAGFSNGCVAVFNIKTKQICHQFRGSDSAVTALFYNQNLMYVGSANFTISVFDLGSDAKLLKTIVLADVPDTIRIAKPARIVVLTKNGRVLFE